MKQLFVTPQGQIDQSKATIKLDGTNWRLDAKSIYENGVQVATKSALTSYATKSDLNSKVNWLNTFVTSCNKDNLWKLNTAWQICITKIEPHCRWVGHFWDLHRSCSTETVYAWEQKFLVDGSNTITNKNIANGAITEDKLAADLRQKIFNPVPIEGRCSWEGLIDTVPDWNMDDTGPHGEGDSLSIYCVDGVRICCLSHESCNPSLKKARSNWNWGRIAKTWWSSGNYTYRNYILPDGTVYCTKENR